MRAGAWKAGVEAAMRERFAIVGAGKVGCALARLLSASGYQFVGAASRTLASAQRACDFAGGGRGSSTAAEVTRGANLVFITTPDDAIAEVCQQLAEAGAFGQSSVVAHCSGAHPSTILGPAKRCGAAIGSMHPLQSFATAEEAVRILPGSFCCIEGEPAAVGALREVAARLGAHVMDIPTEGKVLYHAAAVFACNFLVGLENAALKVDEAAGISREDALQSLLPLIKGTVNNLERVGIPQCLTGPIARGDIETTRQHLDALEEKLPELLPLYKALGRETVEVARAKGTLSEEGAKRLLEMFNRR